jgi:imidazolonepropionase-like amidohydrolase
MGKFGPLLGLLLLWLSGCKPSEESHSQAILGAVLIDGRGGPPLTDSVVVVAGGLIRAAGARSTVPIPAEAAKINGAGKFLVPGLVDACDGPASAAALHPANPAEARTQVVAVAAKGAKVIHLRADVPYEAAEAAVEAARTAGIPLIARASTISGLRRLVDAGASGFVGMVPDTEPLDAALIAHLRDLRVFIAPVLIKTAAAHNTAQAFRGGVPIVLASDGGDLQRELELMVEAGIPPLDAIVAGTRNSAAAVGQLTRAGTVEAGKDANLLLVSANPGEDVANLRKVALRILWMESAH